ncbi:MAG: hypothetical protein QG671_3800 [Actinomycetota bacterium]|nr:hypothetical protein [Actinomycetota bacterium]
MFIVLRAARRPSATRAPSCDPRAISRGLKGFVAGISGHLFVQVGGVCPGDRAAFQAGHAGSIPVTRSPEKDLVRGESPDQVPIFSFSRSWFVPAACPLDCGPLPCGPEPRQPRGSGVRSGCCTTVVLVADGVLSPPGYQAMSLAQLGALLKGADEPRFWRLVAEFLEEYRWEPADERHHLLASAPPGTGDEHWDVFLAALAEHLAARDGRAAPSWANKRTLRRFWFPFNSPAARTDALVHAPAAFRRRGVYVAAQELNVA